MSRKATVGISEFPFVSDLKKMSIGMIDTTYNHFLSKFKNHINFFRLQSYRCRRSKVGKKKVGKNV